MSDSEKLQFENLALGYMAKLYARAVRLARSAKEAEGLVQQTFASAYGAFEQYDQRNDFSAWLNNILKVIYSNTRPRFQAITVERRGQVG
jgi:RNA polymerase sigma-70 factor, ECF subfamily